MLATTIGGLLTGGVYALLGLCTLLTYRLLSVVNFAQTAVGAFGAFVMVLLWETGVPLVAAVVLGILAGALLHAGIGFLMVRFLSEASEEVKAAVTVVLFTAMLGLGGLLFGAEHPHKFPEPFSAPAFEVGGVTIVWTAVVTVGLAILFTLVPILVLSRTKIGLALRAVSDRPTTAQLVGVAAPRLAVTVWVVTGALTALAIMVVAPTLPNDFNSLSLLIVWAFAAVLLGAFRSFWATLIGGLALGALQGLLSSIQELSVYRGVLPLVVIILVLVWRQRHARYDEVA